MNLACRTLLVVLCALPQSVCAGDTASSVTGQCLTNKGLGELCTAISLLQEEPNKDSLYLHRYHRIVDEAACASYEDDDPHEYSRKVRDLWESRPNDFVCRNIPGFDVNPGSALKLAVRYQFKDFLVTAA